MERELEIGVSIYIYIYIKINKPKPKAQSKRICPPSPYIDSLLSQKNKDCCKKARFRNLRKLWSIYNFKLQTMKKWLYRECFTLTRNYY